MYNRKRQVRECTNQVIIYDTIMRTFNIIKAKGISVPPRKDHCAAIFGQSMIVYGGQYQNGAIAQDMLNFDLEYNDWSRLAIKQKHEPLMHMTCCSVQTYKKQSA